MAERMNVESFNLDHRTVAAPYIRVADRKVIGGAHLTKFDVRFTQPNVAALASESVHSLEHMMAEFSRNHSAEIIDISPMGCRTGFYMLMAGEHTVEDAVAIVESTLRDLLEASEVPAANEVQCGWGAHHSLEGAKAAAREFLSHRDEWMQVEAA